MQIGDILDRSAIALRVGATDKRQILAHLAELAGRHFALDAGVVLDALAQDVGVVGVFSDWPATVTYYANCAGL